MKQPIEAFNEILTLLDYYILKNKDVANNRSAYIQAAREAMVSVFKAVPINYKYLKPYIADKLIDIFKPNIMTAIDTTEFSLLRNELLAVVNSWPSHEDYLEWQVKELSNYAAGLKAENIRLTEQLEFGLDKHTDECLQQITLMSIKDNAIDTLSEQLAAALTQIHELTINPPRNYLHASTSSLSTAINVRTSPTLSSKKLGHQPMNYKR